MSVHRVSLWQDGLGSECWPPVGMLWISPYYRRGGPAIPRLAKRGHREREMKRQIPGRPITAQLSLPAWDAQPTVSPMIRGSLELKISGIEALEILG